METYTNYKKSPKLCLPCFNTKKYLVGRTLWWTGPRFLTQSSDIWPSAINVSNLEPNEYQLEEKLITLLQINLKGNENFCTSWLLKTYLDPEVDLLKVGGRHWEFKLSYESKHLNLISKQSQLTILLIDYVHRSYCNPRPQTTKNILNQEFWIISVHSVIQKRLRQVYLTSKQNSRLCSLVWGIYHDQEWLAPKHLPR